jgi:hypothetical protein
VKRSRNNLIEAGVPVLTRFEDGRSGIMYKFSEFGFVDGTIDWTDARKTRSALYVGRCVVVRTYHDRYLAVGQRTVVSLGELKPEIPAFGSGKDKQVPHRQYPEGIPALTIGEAWTPAQELAGDSSHIDFAHVDWSCGSGSGHVLRLGEHNYFDAAREALAVHEPEAQQQRN